MYNKYLAFGRPLLSGHLSTNICQNLQAVKREHGRLTSTQGQVNDCLPAFLLISAVTCINKHSCKCLNIWNKREMKYSLVSLSEDPIFLCWSKLVVFADCSYKIRGQEESKFPGAKASRSGLEWSTGQRISRSNCLGDLSARAEAWRHRGSLTGAAATRPSVTETGFSTAAADVIIYQVKHNYSDVSRHQRHWGGKSFAQLRCLKKIGNLNNRTDLFIREDDSKPEWWWHYSRPKGRLVQMKQRSSLILCSFSRFNGIKFCRSQILNGSEVFGDS